MIWFVGVAAAIIVCCLTHQCVAAAVDETAVIFITKSLLCQCCFMCHANAIIMTPKSFFYTK